MRLLCVLGAVAVLSLASCGTTKVTTMVRRAPEVSLKGAKTVRLEVSAVCQDLWRGPDQVVSKTKDEFDAGLVKLTLTTTTRKNELVVWKSEDCGSSPLMAKALAEALARIQARLTREGYTVVQSGQADHTLKVELELNKSRELRLDGKRKDSKTDSTCVKTCAKPECLEYHWFGELTLAGRLTGPPLASGDAQVTVAVGIARPFKPTKKLAIGDDYERIFSCSALDASCRLFSESNYDWNLGLVDALRTFDGYLAKGLNSWNEEYDYILLAIDNCETCEQATKLAEKKDWSMALQKCLEGITEVSGQQPNDRKIMAKALYNQAVALVALGRLDAALNALGNSLSTEKLTVAQELAEEIGRRIVDREKLNQVGVRSQDPK